MQAAPHFTWPPVTDRTRTAVLDQLAAGVSIYDRSGVVERLETTLADYHGARHAVLTNSSTAALHSMYAACRLGPEDEVIVPAYTFFATVTPLLHLGARPVLADCDANGNLDLHDVPRRITDRTAAVVVTHMWGVPADVERLRAIASEHDLMLFEDGSHAHGSTVKNRPVGTFGRAAAFSMNGPKPLSAGEGGFILTDDDEVYYRALLHRQYNKRCRNEIPLDHPLYPYAVTGMGLKFRIHPLAAAIALDQLDHLDEYLAGRETFAKYLCEQLGELPGIAVPRLGPDVRASWYGLILQYQADELGGLPVERFHEALKAEGCHEVDRPGSTCPLNLLPLFQKPGPLFADFGGELRYKRGDFPRAEALHHNTLKLPVWHKEEDMPLADNYIEAFRKVTANYHDLLEHMVDTSLLERLSAEAEKDSVQQLVVGAVVQHDGKVLLLKRPDDDFMGGIFELPSGKVEPGEALDVALIREVKEETGLDVAGIREYLGHFDYQSGSGKKSRQFNFAVDVSASEPVVLQEHDSYLWAELSEEPPVTDAVKDVLARYRQLDG
jgi:mutator protein MutT